jgi:hypothetical protein
VRTAQQRRSSVAGVLSTAAPAAAPAKQPQQQRPGSARPGSAAPKRTSALGKPSPQRRRHELDDDHDHHDLGSPLDDSMDYHHAAVFQFG